MSISPRHLFLISCLLVCLRFVQSYCPRFSFNMATQNEERKASAASALPSYDLASEDDAAVLGRSMSVEVKPRTYV